MYSPPFNFKKCAYCEVKMDRVSHNHSTFRTKDHIIPLSRGGKTGIHNILYCCRSCNGSKDNKFLEEWLEELQTGNFGSIDSNKVSTIIKNINHILNHLKQ